jgi:hypothetical protein
MPISTIHEKIIRTMASKVLEPLVTGRGKNTKFFHNQAKSRQRKKNVSKMALEDGTIVSDFSEIKDAAKSHFEKPYTLDNNASQDNLDTMLEHILSLISNEDNLDLTKTISEEEICDAVWILEPKKYPSVMGLIGKCGHKQISLDPPRSRTKHNRI